MKCFKVCLATLLIFMSILMNFASEASNTPLTVSGDPFVEPVRIRATCYTANPEAVTASGSYVREGILAGKREWLGMAAEVYNEDMEFLGYFEFKDTGAGIDTDGDGVGDSIRNGLSVDIFRNDLDACHMWINTVGDYIYIRIIPGVG